jgi:anti-sigma factor RsiW
MSPDKLFDYLDGKLSPADRTQLEEKLMSDPQLRQQFNIAREIHRSGRDSREVVMP